MYLSNRQGTRRGLLVFFVPTHILINSQKTAANPITEITIFTNGVSEGWWMVRIFFEKRRARMHRRLLAARLLAFLFGLLSLFVEASTS